MGANVQLRAMKQENQVGKAVQQFLKSLRERNVSPHTIKAYSGDLENFSAYIGARKWREIDHIVIRGFLSSLYEKGLSKTSVARALAAVRSLYKWLAVEGIVEQNPAALVSTPKLPKKLPRVPTMEEMNSVFDGNMPAVASFPEDFRSVRSFVERSTSNIVQWTEMPAGGHFAAHDAPALLVNDIGSAFAGLR